MRVAILGPAGFLGSYVSTGLLRRGHEVIGISRNPEKLGTHPCYHPIKFDIAASSIEKFIEVFKDADVVVNCYNPGLIGDVYST